MSLKENLLKKNYTEKFIYSVKIKHQINRPI